MATLEGTETLTNKTLEDPTITDSTGMYTLTLPSSTHLRAGGESQTLVTDTCTATLTHKTLLNPTLRYSSSGANLRVPDDLH